MCAYFGFTHNLFWFIACPSIILPFRSHLSQRPVYNLSALRFSILSVSIHFITVISNNLIRKYLLNIIRYIDFVNVCGYKRISIHLIKNILPRFNSKREYGRHNLMLEFHFNFDRKTSFSIFACFMIDINVPLASSLWFGTVTSSR